MSPRSGTPVKLLGREDASVDWYNLEKSKRVKAFRCREFDACIEKAEASQGIPIKKREKYARREDAIVHALELERKQLEAKQLNSGFSTNDVTNKYLGSHRRDFKNVSGSDIYSRNNEPGMHSKFSVHKSQSFVEKLALFHEDMDNPSYVHMEKNDKHIEWQEDIPEAIHRMRGLQDFHIGSKKKLSQFVSWEPRKPAGNNLDLPSTGQLLGGINHACSGRSTLEVKRKRSRGALVEESIAKKWDRRRPLVQVLRCSAKLSVSHSSQPDHDPYAIPMQGENEQMIVCQSKRSKCIYLPTDRSDSLGHGGNPSEEALIPGKQFVTDNCMDLPGSLTEEYTSSGMIGKNELDSSGKEYFETVTDEADLLRDAAQFSSGSKRCNAAAFEVSEKLRDMNNKEVPLPKYAPQLHLYDHTADASAEVGVSMWHMKGKRNIRNQARRPTALMDEKISITNSGQCDECPREMTNGTKGCNFVRAETELSSQRTEQHGFYHDKEVSYASGKLDLICEDFGQGQTGYGDRRYSSILKAARGHRRTRIHFSDLENESHMISVSGWEADGPSYASQKSYWKESDECYDSVYAAHIRKERRPMLVDVDLTVQASYQREHVPLVSLRSRLNGKAIVGHPLQTEILEDGSTDQYFSGDCAGSDESLAPQPAWRTARRTAVQRVPRSNTVTSALEGEDTGVLCPDQDRKPPLKSGYFNHQIRLAKKNILHAPRQAGMSQKPLKNVSLSSKKTRRFSSIGTKQKLGGENGELKLINSSDILGGLIEPDGAVPMVTCVPVKIAFSRILEAVGRPSAAAHRARMISAALRDPS